MRVQRHMHEGFLNIRRKSPTTVLALCWVSGILFGITLYFSADDSLVSSIRRIPIGFVSMPSLLVTALLPLFISALLVYIGSPVVLLLFSFARVAVFTYISMGVMAAFGNAGWLMLYLLMFSDLWSMAFLYYFNMRQITASGSFSISGCGTCFVLLSLIVCFDFYFIAPGLVYLL